MGIFDTLYGFGQGILNLIPGQGQTTPPPQATLPQSSTPSSQPSSGASFSNVQLPTTPPAQPQPAPIQQQEASSGASFSNVLISAPVKAVQAQPQAPLDFNLYVPAADRAQREVPVRAVIYDPVGGGFGGYQVPQRSEPGFTRIYGGIATSGSSGALQSGKVSLTPLTPVVFTQESASKYAPSARPELAALVLASPEKYSRIGAEMYGGYVLPLDDRRMSPTTQLGGYPAASGNLANLVDQYGVNRPKEAWATMPWSIDTRNAPRFQTISPEGVYGVPSAAGLTSIGLKPAPKLPAYQGGALMGEPLDASRYKPLPLLGEGGAPQEFTKVRSTLIPSEYSQSMITAYATKSGGSGDTPLTPMIVGVSDWFLGSSNPVAGMIKMLPTMILGRDIFTRSMEDTFVGKPVLGEITTKKSSSTTPPEITSVYNPATGETTTTTTTLTTLTEDTFQPVTTTTKTIITPMKGGFDIGEERAAEYTKKWIPEMNPAKPTGNVVLDYVAGFGRGVYEGVRTKPLTALTNVGVGLAIVVGGEIISGLGAATTTAATGTRLYPIAKGLEWTATKALPTVLMSAYVADVGIRTTKPVVTPGTGIIPKTEFDLSPKAAERFGVISGQEIIPFGTGAVLYAPLKTGVVKTYEFARLQEIDIKAFTQEKYGIEPIEYGTIGYKQAAGISADYLKASTGEAAGQGITFAKEVPGAITKPYRAMEIDYLAMKQEGIIGQPGITNTRGTFIERVVGKIYKPSEVAYKSAALDYTRGGYPDFLEATRLENPIKTAVMGKEILDLHYGIDIYGEPVGGKTIYRGLSGKGIDVISGKNVGDIYESSGFQSFTETPEYATQYSKTYGRGGYKDILSGTRQKTILEYTPSEGVKASTVNVVQSEYTLQSGKYKVSGVREELIRGSFTSRVEGKIFESGPAEKVKVFTIEDIPSKASPVLEYAKYKASLPAQYVMAKGEAGMMWAGEVSGKAKGILFEPTQSTSADIGGRISSRANLFPEAQIGRMAYGEQTAPDWFTRVTTSKSPDIGGRASYYAEGALGTTAYGEKWMPTLRQVPGYLEISAKSFIQEVTAKPSPGALLGITQGKGERGAPAIRQDHGGDIGGSRMGYKTVGGKQVSGLKPELSLQAMGKDFGTAELGGTEKGGMYIQRMDFRGRPISETMKPMDLSQTKQSAISLSIMTEPLPGMEPMTAPGRMPAIAGGFSLFRAQVPSARTQTEELFTETRQERSQRQSYVTTIKPSFAVTPATQYRQIFAMEPITSQARKQTEVNVAMMSFDVMQGQKQRGVQQQAMAFSTDQLFKRSQESIRRQDFVTDQFRDTRRKQDIITIPRVTQIPFQDTTTRQRTDIIVTPRITQTPFRDIVTTKITTGGGLPFPLAGGGGFGSFLKGKRQHLEFFKIGQGIRDINILGGLEPAKKRTNVRTVYGEERGSFKTHSGTIRVKELPPGSKIVVQKGRKPKSPKQSVYGTRQGGFSTFSGGINIKGAKRRKR